MVAEIKIWGDGEIYNYRTIYGNSVYWVEGAVGKQIDIRTTDRKTTIYTAGEVEIVAVRGSKGRVDEVPLSIGDDRWQRIIGLRGDSVAIMTRGSSEDGSREIILVQHLSR